MKMHPYYTEVPLRSFEAIVQNDWLSEILLALITDPLEAEDFAKLLSRGQPETIYVYTDESKNFQAPLPISVDDFACLPAKSVSKWRITMAQWLAKQQSSHSTFLELSLYDTRMCMWAACYLARHSVRYIESPSDNMLRTLSAAENFIATGRDKSAIFNASRDLYRETAKMPYDDYSEIQWAHNATKKAVNATLSLSDHRYISDCALYTMEDVASVIACSKTEDDRSRFTEVMDQEFDQLNQVVAQSCMTFPMICRS